MYADAFVRFVTLDVSGADSYTRAVAQAREPRADLPEGTVTLLFTDIEGSTQLLRKLGPQYTEVQERHRRLLRASFDRFGGIEVDTQGDAFMVAFRSATDAGAAAVEVQRALAAEQWPEDVGVPVRMGLHTGEPQRGPEGYVGIDVVRASRICSVAHGRQILVSQLTRDLLAEVGLETVDLGRHRLKDIGEPERLYQLVGDGLHETFPPPKTLGGATLPALHHRLVGRQVVLGEIQTLLARPDVRLVTITGAGGAGKSRLALEVVASAALERPVYLVGLAPVSDPTLVLGEIARTVGGVEESAGRPLAEGIADELRGSRTLLFLDNLEHLAPAARDVATLLDLVPDLDVLATSRAPLRLSGEHVLPLDPLPVDDAATLFVELAAARGVVLQENATPSVREICRRLDGLPLAIELGAARLVVLPPPRILQALDEGLALEMEGPVDLPERQRTLRATIAWSYGLLSESQRQLHNALAVFAGGCTFEDARAVAQAGSGFFRDLESLVAWSLVRSDVTDGDARLSMLETVREDAAARAAAAGKLDDLRRRHAERFLELTRAAADELAGANQVEWLERLERELDNVRGTLDWCFSSGRVEEALTAISALDRFWRAHGHVSEARRWLGLGLALADDAPREVRADALWTAARQAAAQSDWDAAVPLLEDALDLFREQCRGREVVFALSELGSVALRRDDTKRAAMFCEEALVLARTLGDPRATSAALNILAEVSRSQGDHERALALAEEAVLLRKALGDPLLIADSTYHLGVAAFESGNLERAENAFGASLSLARELGEVLFTGAALCMLGSIALLRDDLSLASDRLHESLGIYTEVEDRRSTAECLCALGGYAAASGEPERAARLWGAADSLRGDSPLEYAEPAIEARFGPGLVESLGVERFAELRAEGKRLGHNRVLWADSGALVASQGTE